MKYKIINKDTGEIVPNAIMDVYYIKNEDVYFIDLQDNITLILAECLKAVPIELEYSQLSNSVKEEIHAYQVVNKNLNEEILELKETISRLYNDNAELQDKYIHLRGKYEGMTDKVAKYMVTLNEKDREIEQQLKRIKTLAERDELLDSQIDELISNRDSDQKTINNLIKEKWGLVAENKGLELQKKCLITDDQDALISQLKKDLEFANTVLSVYRNASSELLDKCYRNHNS